MDPPVYSRPHSVAHVAREAAAFAVKQTMKYFGAPSKGHPKSYFKSIAYNTHIILTAASAADSAPLSYAAFLAAATAIEGVAALGIDFGTGGFPLDEQLEPRVIMVVDTAIATAVAAADGFESTKASPDADSH